MAQNSYRDNKGYHVYRLSTEPTSALSATGKAQGQLRADLGTVRPIAALQHVVQQEAAMSDVREELFAYERLLPSLLKDHAGEFVVLEGQEAVHFDSDYERALTWAFEHSGEGRVFVKQVVPDGAQSHFTRDIGPWQKGS